MSKARMFGIGFLICAAGLYALFKYHFPSYTHRYEMTLEVQVGDEIRSGSSVVQVRWQREIRIIGFSVSVRGQAALIDLGDKGVLFMALGGSGDSKVASPSMLAFNAYRDSGLVPMKVNDFAHNLTLLSKPRERLPLLPDNRPQFIWLSDRNDPSTARPVKAEEFSSVIAPDIHFRGAWVQTTRKSVTKDLAKKLPWIKKFAQPKATSGMYNKFNFTWDLLSQGVSL